MLKLLLSYIDARGPGGDRGNFLLLIILFLTLTWRLMMLSGVELPVSRFGFFQTAYLKISIERQIHQLRYLISSQQAQYVWTHYKNRDLALLA